MYGGRDLHGSVYHHPNGQEGQTSTVLMNFRTVNVQSPPEEYCYSGSPPGYSDFSTIRDGKIKAH